MAGSRRAAACVTVLAVIAAGREARADGLRLYLEPAYVYALTSTSDPGGATRESRADTLVQKYRLNLDRTFFPNLRLEAGGIFDDSWTWGRDETGHTLSDLRNWSYHGNLSLSSAVVSSSLVYNHRTESTKSLGSPRQDYLADTATFGVSYRPSDLPSLSLLLSHNTLADDQRKLRDSVIDEMQVSTAYAAGGKSGHYTFRLARQQDRVVAVTSTTAANLLQASYSDRLLDNRLTLSASVNGSAQTSWVRATSTAGAIATQQYPVAGLSHVQVFPDRSDRDQLEENRALIDGDQLTSAGLSIGYAATAAGDTQPRDLGVRMADDLTPVSAIYVWVDRQLTAEVSAAFSWQAYSSDDNLNWTRVDLAPAPGQVQPVVFGTFQNRFEVNITPTRKRYLKVVVSPLDVGTSTNPAFADIRITEVQVFFVQPAADVTGKTNTATMSVTGAERLRLLDNHELFHDASFVVNTTVLPSTHSTWTFDTGLSYSRRFASIAAFSSRVSRQDLDSGNGHAATTAITGSLSVRPLDTLMHGLTFTEQLHQDRAGSSTLGSVSVFNRADLYRGVALQAGAGLTFGTNLQGQRQLGRQVNVNTSLAPNPKLSFQGSYVYDETSLSRAGRLTETVGGDQWQGGLSFNPFPALFASVALSYTRRAGMKDQLLSNFGGSFSPFPDGNVQLRVAYNESLDDAAGGRTRLASSGVHWKVRPNSFLDATYTYFDVNGIQGRNRSHVVAVNLLVGL